MAVYKRDIIDINLETGNIYRSWLKHSIGMKDQKADHFGVRVFRNGEAVSLTGVSVQGVFMPPEGSPIAITSGNIVSGNVAEVVLPQACYNYDGQFTLAIKLVDSTNSVTGTVRIVDGMVDNTHASGTVAPTSAVPTYQEVLSVYEQAITVIGKSVRFDTDQSLTDAQKTTARTNIAAASTGELSDVKSAVNSGLMQNIIAGTWTTGKAIRYDTGAEYDSAVFDYITITLPAGLIGKIGVLTTVWTPGADIAYYDANDNFIIGYAKLTQTVPTDPLYSEIPTGAAKIKVCCRQGATYKDACKCFYSVEKSIKDTYDKNHNDLKNLNLNLLLDASWESGAYKVYTGEEVVASYYKRCLIDLPCDQSKLTYRTIATSPNTNLVFFDSDGDYICDYFSLINPAEWEEETVNIPDGAKKVGLSFYSGATGNNHIEECKLFIDVPKTLKNKQNKLTFDPVPTTSSTNPVESGGIKEYVDDAVYPLTNMKTKTDGVVEIYDGASGSKIKQYVINIVPNQSGSGTPSPTNVRAITGHTQITINQSGQTTEDPETITESLEGNTVYFGEADITNGTLLSEAGLAVFDGSSDENWGLSGTTFYISVSGMKSVNIYEKGVANWLPTISRSSEFGIRIGANTNYLYLYNIPSNIQGVSTVADLKAYLAEHPLQVTYPLNNAVTATIERQPITLNEYNHLWSNAGTSTIKYVVSIYDFVNKWKGKKYACIGDSITWGFTPKNTPGYRSQLDSYAKLTADDLEMDFVNQGISGCTFAVVPGHEQDLYPIATRWDDLPDDADLITVTGGTNDVRLGVPLGTMADRGTNTYYGAWHTVLGGLYKKYFIDQGVTVGKQKKIVAITPIKLIGEPATTEGGNGTLYQWDSWIVAIKEVAAYYSIPVLDFNILSNINPHLNCTVYDSENGKYYNPYITDGVHPTQEGARIMADVLMGFLNTLE